MYPNTDSTFKSTVSRVYSIFFLYNYEDKVNVTKEHVTVPMHMVSSWLTSLGVVPRSKNTFNILKANVEGAEWELIRDLDINNIFSEFNILCGSGGWLGDMAKIPSITSKRAEAAKILKKNKVTVHTYVGHSDTYNVTSYMRNNVNMLSRIQSFQNTSCTKL